MARSVILDVPAMPCVVRDGVFDAWSWCESDRLEWRTPARAVPFDAPIASIAPIDGTNPPGLVFVVHRDAECTFLPREPARLHAFGYGLADEDALAPWAIDDATDLLYEHRVRPRDVLWLAAPTLDALVWGLHDWVHFHNHGPFDDPPTTELGCDLVALAWLRLNRDRIGVDDATIARVAGELAALSRRRFAEAGSEPPVSDFETLFAGDYPRSRVSLAPTRA